MKRVVVKSLDDLDVVLRLARDLFDQKGKCDVVVKNHSESLRDAQRGLYWRWVKPIAEHHGYTEGEMHEIFKERFLLRIFLNDTLRHPHLEGAAENMAIVKEKAPEQYPHVRQLVLKGVSHMDASKENMMDYLREVEAHAIAYKVRLPAPERKGLVYEVPKKNHSKALAA